MRTSFVLCLLAAVAASAAHADEITDAMLGVDPRDQYESGTGHLYEDTYGPPDESTEDASELGLDATTPPESLGSTYQGLRSPLYEDPQTWPPREGSHRLLSPDSPDTAPDLTAPEAEDAAGAPQY